VTARTGHGFVKSFVAGIVAGALAIGISLLIRSLVGGPFLPELASQTLFSLTPGEFESQAVENFGPLAKYSAFIAALVINFVLYGLFGILVDKLHSKFPWKGYIGKSLQSALIVYVILLIMSISLITTIQLRTGGGGSISISLLAISLVLPQIIFGFIFSSFFRGTGRILKKRPETTSETSGMNSGRREFLRLVVVSAIAFPLLFFGLNRLFSGQGQEQQETSSSSSQLIPQSLSKPIGFEDPMLATLLASELTPTYLFYRIDINPIVPVVDEKTWNLTVKGLVGNPVTVTYGEIKSMPFVEQYATLECVSNKIGGDLIGTALWRGIRLKDLLDRAKVMPGAKYIVFRCSDGYDVGIPLENGMMDGTLLAYDMNLAPLTTAHGFPVRAIVPGLYGMMNPKWITEIEIVDNVYEGYWQRNGWTNTADVHTNSSIVIPGQAPIRHRFRKLDETPNIVPGEKAPIAGIAFGGDRGISKVEVSTDGGTIWKSAVIKDPLSRFTWVLWTAGFTPTGKENYKIVVRATDKTGQVQTSELNKPFPDGATGYHMVNV
jgi:DMSO/TMAO reductase YedYZ molybdopterin-dependent catalytic subunit